MADNSPSTNTNQTKAKTTKPATKPAVAEKTSTSAIPQQVDLMWTVAIAVVMFVLGFFVNSLFAAPQPGTTAPPTSSLTSPEAGVPGATTAPTLSQDQLEGGLPQGHPDINGGASGESTQSSSQGAGSAPSDDGFTNVPGGADNGSMGGKTSDVPASGSLGQDDQSVEVPAGKDPNKN